jgi:hypothetical protein
LGKFLEDEILFGAISARRHANRLELMYNPSESVSLELNVSSSMVKELTPLVLYLKYLANPGDLIVIDEPEMNLHPVAQVQIAEFLGMLVNAGLYVLITTHSPYPYNATYGFLFAILSDSCHTAQYTLKGGGRPCSRVRDVTNTSTRSRNSIWTETML